MDFNRDKLLVRLQCIVNHFAYGDPQAMNDLDYFFKDLLINYSDLINDDLYELHSEKISFIETLLEEVVILKNQYDYLNESE
jgi:hypothetical protein